MVKWLLKNGANIHLKTKDGKTAEDLANDKSSDKKVRYKCKKVAKYLKSLK